MLGRGGADTGENSRDPSHAEIEAVRAALPDARLVAIAGQEHVADVMVPDVFSRHLLTFLQSQTKEGKFLYDMNDQITSDTLLTRGGQIVNKRIREHFGMPPLA